MKKSIFRLTMSALVLGGIMMLVSCDKSSSIYNSSHVSTSENSTSPQAPVAYNGCGGGCISTNSRCCGTCSESGWRSSCGPAEYWCLKIKQETQPPTFRYECWHIGPDFAVWTGNYNFGLDLSNPVLQDAQYYKVIREIGVDSTFVFDTQFAYNEENTIAFFDQDTILETLLPSLKYKVNFFDTLDQLLLTIDYYHQ